MKRKLLITVIVSLLANGAGAQILNLSRAPVFVKAAVDPNIILTFDDSGSMGRGYTPNELDGTYMPNATADCFWRHYPHYFSAASNSQYYDPNAIYLPAKREDGTDFPNAVFTDAYVDAVAAFRGGAVNNNITRYNLATGYRAIRSWDPPDDNVSAGGLSTISFAAADGGGGCGGGGTRQLPNAGALAATRAVRAFYYTFADPTAGTPPTIADLYGTAGTGRNATLYTLVEVPANATAEQNFANWYSYYSSRVTMGRTAATIAFSNLPRNVRIQWQGINNNHIGNGSAIREIANNTQRQNFYNYLQTVGHNGGTPTRAAITRVVNYLNNNNTSGLTASNPYYDAATNQLLSCRQNYSLVFTDGGWKDNVGAFNNQNHDQTAIANLPCTYVSTLQPCVTGRAYNTSDSQTQLYWSGPDQGNIGGFADLAFRFWATDLRTDLRNNVSPFLDDRTTGIVGSVVSPLPADPWTVDEIYWNPKNDPATWQHLVQYVVAFGLQSSLDFPGDLNNLRKGVKIWTEWGSSENGEPASKVDDTWHGTLSSRGELLGASSPQDLVQQLNSVFQAITNRNASVTAVSISSGLLTTNTLAYRTFFNAGSWAGSVQATKLNLSGGTGGVVWDAACKLTGGPCASMGGTSFPTPAPSSRNIYTFNGTAGVNFTWGNLSSAQQSQMNYDWDTNVVDTLGPQRLDYVRGVRTGEGTTYRSRESVMGAVVSSNALYVGPNVVDDYWNLQSDCTASTIFPGTSSPETCASYKTHITNVQALRTGKETLYVGANDGMLHALDAQTGDERWAFIPGTVVRNLSRLTSKTNLYTQSYVDATPQVREMFVNGGWKTVLVGALRFGGQGIYALDVTNPSPSVSAAGRFMWEFNDKSAGGSDLGYTYGRPYITRLESGQWVVLVPGGYNSSETEFTPSSYPTPETASSVSTTGNAVLFVLNAANGSVIRKFDLGAGTKGLSGVTGGDYVYEPGAVSAPTNPVRATASDSSSSNNRRFKDELTDVAFAGDDDGNLWRFNLDSPTPSSWSVVKFFDAPANQQITVAPRLVLASKRAIVAFGTGRYVTTSDRGTTFQQSLYGIYDPGPNFSGYPLTQGNLLNQAVTSFTAGSKKLYRTGTADVPSNRFGWFVNLPESGERNVVSATVLASTNKLIFPTFIPSADPTAANDPCRDESASTLYFLNPLNGSPGTTGQTAAFDVNGDGFVNGSDDATVSGVQVPGFLAGGTPITQAGGGQASVLIPQANGGVGTIDVSDFPWRRMNTRELPAWEKDNLN